MSFGCLATPWEVVGKTGLVLVAVFKRSNVQAFKESPHGIILMIRRVAIAITITDCNT